jgi:rod shape-determining protein MreB and related proteins
MSSWFKRSIGRDMAIDLGTTRTRVYTPEKGIVVDEPTVVAVNTRTEHIIAVGEEARLMIGKTPPHIVVTRPLTKGIISDYEVAEKLLRFFVEKVFDGMPRFTARPRMILSVPLQCTEVEMKAVEDAAIASGARDVAIVQAPMAGAIGARMPIEGPIGNMIVDLGGGKTEVSVISLAGVVAWRSTPYAGEEMNKNIIQYARDVHNVFIGDSHAEHIKLKLGTVREQAETVEFPMRGRDLVSGLPKEVIVSNAQIRSALERTVEQILETVHATLESTPPALTADIHDRGLLLTGGGAELSGIDELIATKTHVPVRIASDPTTTVVRGCGILLEHEALLDEVRLASARKARV